MLAAVCLGNVDIPVWKCLRIFRAALTGTEASDPGTASILLAVRLPRVLCVALSGASLSVCGAAMQGLLKNPLADGSTLGISSGASLGAALAIAFGFQFPRLPFSGSVILAALFAFASLILILSLSYILDSSFSTNTIILPGIVYYAVFCHRRKSEHPAPIQARDACFHQNNSVFGSRFIRLATSLAGFAP